MANPKSYREFKSAQSFFRSRCPVCGKPLSEQDLAIIVSGTRTHLRIRCCKCEQTTGASISYAVLDDIGISRDALPRIPQAPKKRRNARFKKPSQAALIQSLANKIPTLEELKSMPYEQYLRTDHWMKLSASVKERAGNKCQLCNGTGTLQAHHRTYENRGEEKLSDMTCLCGTCHKRFHWK